MSSFEDLVNKLVNSRDICKRNGYNRERYIIRHTEQLFQLIGKAFIDVSNMSREGIDSATDRRIHEACKEAWRVITDSFDMAERQN